MIRFFSGTPGSGKSYHMAKEISFKLRLGRNIICSEEINLNKVSDFGRKKIGKFVHLPIEEMNPEYFYMYAYENHIKGKEKQTIIIMDECHRIFNPREWGRKDRKDWLIFFSEHRHIGYDIILVSQNDRQVDRQIRSQFEHEIKHRKVNNMHSLAFLLPTMFVCVEKYYGNNMIISKNFMMFRKRIGNIYDSHAKFDDFIKRMDRKVEELGANSRNISVPGTDARGGDEHPEPFPKYVNPTLLPKNITNDSENIHPHTEPADMQMGVGGPYLRGRRRKVSWWIRPLLTASIKGRKKAK
jgi:hypothetical protein